MNSKLVDLSSHIYETYNESVKIDNSLCDIVDVDVREQLFKINTMIKSIEGVCVIALDGEKIVLGVIKGMKRNEGDPLTLLIRMWMEIQKARFTGASMRHYNSPYACKNVLPLYDCGCYMSHWESCSSKCISKILSDFISILTLVTIRSLN